MRGLFLLLLLTNLAFVAWQYYARGGGEQEKTDVYRGVRMVKDGLTMIGELPPAEQPPLRDSTEETGDRAMAGSADAQEPSPVPSEADAGAQEVVSATGQESTAQAPAECMRISGIDNRQTLDRILILLRDSGASAIEQGEGQFKRTSYWVMLPPYQSRSKADEAAAILEARQVKDFFIVRSGDYENAVSLGVFSTRERAQRRYRQIEALKVRLRTPKIEAIELPAKAYSVSYKVTERGARTRIEDALGALAIPRSEEITCK